MSIIEIREDAHLEEFWKWFVAPLGDLSPSKFAPRWTREFMWLSLDVPVKGPWRLKPYYGDLGVSLGRGPKVQVTRVDDSGMEVDEFIFADEEALDRAQREVEAKWIDVDPENEELQDRFVAGGLGWL